MANEAVKVEGPYEIHDYTVSTSVAIEQGVLCKVADARLASAATGSGEPFAGITATEFVADVGKVELGLHTTGTFLLKAAAAGALITAPGIIVVMSGPNQIRAAVSGELLTGAVIGKTKETIADGTTGEVTLGGF